MVIVEHENGSHSNYICLESVEVLITERRSFLTHPVRRVLYEKKQYEMRVKPICYDAVAMKRV